MSDMPARLNEPERQILAMPLLSVEENLSTLCRYQGTY